MNHVGWRWTEEAGSLRVHPSPRTSQKRQPNFGWTDASGLLLIQQEAKEIRID